MTDIEQKAQSLFSQVLSERGALNRNIDRLVSAHEALFRAIEQHEAFRQEVSDAIVDYFGAHLVAEDGGDALASLVIPAPKPDPLVEVINDADDMVRKPDAPSYAEAIRAALAARGFEIREKNDD